MKTNNIKRIIAIYLAVVFVLSVIAIVGVSAKTYTYTHTVEVASVPGSSDSLGISMGGKGRISDTFQAYPTIYNGYSSSNNKSRVYNKDVTEYHEWNDFTLYGNSGAPKTIIYGDEFPATSYEIQYRNVSQGGFKAETILSRTY